MTTEHMTVEEAEAALAALLSEKTTLTREIAELDAALTAKRKRYSSLTSRYSLNEIERARHAVADAKSRVLFDASPPAVWATGGWYSREGRLVRETPKSIYVQDGPGHTPCRFSKETGKRGSSDVYGILDVPACLAILRGEK